MIFLVAAASAQVTPPVPPQLAEVDSQVYRVPMDSNPTLWTESSGRITDGFEGRARLFGQYVHRPFIFVDAFSDEVTEIVTGLGQVNLLGMVDYNRFRLGVDIPVILYSAGLDSGGAGLGDLEVDGRVTVLDRSDYPVGIGVSGRLALPTTTLDLTGFGAGAVRGEVMVKADADATEELFVGANLGARFNPRSELQNIGLDDQLIARAGAGYKITDAAGVSLDFNAQVNLRDPGEAGVPIEGLLGGWGRFSDFMVRGGLGRGLTPGIGSPTFRVLLGLAYEPAGEALDTDGDGIVDKKDDCPEEPEDLDGVKDTDGCPEPTLIYIRVQDTAGEAIPDAKWSFEKGDLFGNPGDEVRLFASTHTVAAEAPGYAPASMEVVVQDTETQTFVVVMEEAINGGTLEVRAVDMSGEPVPGSTWTLRSKRDDSHATGEAVALEAGKYNVRVAAEGFRPTTAEVEIEVKEDEVLTVNLKPAKVVLTPEKIDIKDSVYFETAKAVIKPESFELLDEVADIIKDHPELAKIRIEGHTDSRGSAAYNKDLSQKRADSVRMYMQNKGVDASRLESIGFGEEKPLDPAENKAAWTKNRRVDFFVSERSD